MRWSIVQSGGAGGLLGKAMAFELEAWGGVGPLPTHLGHRLEEGTTSISHHLKGTSSPGLQQETI